MTRRHYNLPSLNALAAFEAVARHLNLTRAAEELNVTPGAVSKQIRHLEDELGHQLLRRHSNGVSLTTEGEAVATSLHDAFDRISATLKSVRAAGEKAPVSIVTTMATMQLWLMPRLGSFWAEHQDIVVEHIISDRLQDVPRPDIDLRIRYGDGHWPGEVAEKIQGDSVVAVASPQFLARQPITSVADLAAAALQQLCHRLAGGPRWTGYRPGLDEPRGPAAGVRRPSAGDGCPACRPEFFLRDLARASPARS
mgnify:CR=1 FL=1